MISEMHDFWFKPPVAGRPTRAQQVDDVLTAVKTGKLTVRAALWMAGAIIAITAALGQVKGLWK